MKKLFLALMALMASVTANAEAFDLWIAGTQVTTLIFLLIREVHSLLQIVFTNKARHEE